MNCSKCSRPATFCSPAAYCDDHWVEWWVDGMHPKTPQQREMFEKEAHDSIANAIKKPKYRRVNF